MRHLHGFALAVLLLLVSAPVFAQQPVTITGTPNVAIPAGVDVATVGGNAVIYDPCLDPSKVLVTNILATAASGSTQLIAVSGSTRVFLCGWQLQGGAAGDITFNFGDGTNCGTNVKAIASIQVVNAGDGALHPAIKTFDRSAAARALCYNRSASMTARGWVATVQEADP
jgi:hypothetical protein